MKKAKFYVSTFILVIGFLFVNSSIVAKAMTAPFLGSWGEGPEIVNNRAQYHFKIVARNMRLEGPAPDEDWKSPEIYTLLPEGVQIDNVKYDSTIMNYVVEDVSAGKLVRFTFYNSLVVNSNWYAAPEIDLTLSVEMTPDRRVYPITKFGSSSVKNQNYPTSGIYIQKDYNNLTNLNDVDRDIVFKEVQNLTYTPVYVPVTGITVNHNALEVLRRGNSKELSATIHPENATNKGVDWSIVGVDNGCVEIKDGKVIGKRAGFVTLKAASAENDQINGTFVLRVTQ